MCDGGAGGGILFGEAGAVYIFFLKMELIRLYVRREKRILFSTKNILTVGKFDSWYQSDSLE
jgi:hypothetical protein